MAEEVIIIFRIPNRGVWKKSHNGNEVIIYLLEETLHCLGPNQYIRGPCDSSGNGHGTESESD